MNIYDKLKKQGFEIFKNDNQRYIINVTSFSRYEQLLSIIEADSYYYRGQCDDSFSLTSTLYRHWNEYNNGKSFTEYESAIISDYITSTKFKNKRIKNILDVMSELQHYGTKTRLVDFSFDPYVASYFALNGIKKRDSIYTAAIYILGKEIFNSKIPDILLEKNITSKKWESIVKLLSLDLTYDKIRLYHYEPALYNNKRAEQQKGLFLFSKNPYHSMDELIDLRSNQRNLLAEDRKPRVINTHNRFKCVLQLSNESLCDFNTQLNKMDICSKYLFPDNEGFYKDLNNKVYF